LQPCGIEQHESPWGAPCVRISWKGARTGAGLGAALAPDALGGEAGRAFQRPPGNQGSERSSSCVVRQVWPHVLG
jgi:hypothetical protein